MKSPVLAAVLFALGTTCAAFAQNPPAEFGSPPSGAYPILFNDHHVYAKPSASRHDRVVAALIRGKTILVPLRSMFEQMGATVSYDPDSRTVDVSKPGADIKLTIGKPEVVINGESRPLDVAPILLRGTILVPVRVISEGMGAYVQWVPSKKSVVVRYLPPAPPPAAAPPAPPPAMMAPPAAPKPPPTPAPTPTPAPSPTPYYDKFIVGDYDLAPKIYNEFSPGNSGTSSYGGRAGIEFPAFGLTFALEGDWRHWTYPHNAGAAAPCPTAGCVTIIGGAGQTYVPAFNATNDDTDVRLALRFANPRLYIGGSYLSLHNNYGYPTLSGAGFGLEKLPDLNQPFTLYGSAWYYPNVQATYNAAVGTLAYKVTRYQIGLDWNPFGGGFPVYVDLGFQGNALNNKLNAPANATEYGGYAGLGIHF